jgi:hypothetical protein
MGSIKNRVEKLYWQAHHFFSHESLQLARDAVEKKLASEQTTSDFDRHCKTYDLLEKKYRRAAGKNRDEIVAEARTICEKEPAVFLRCTVRELDKWIAISHHGIVLPTSKTRWLLETIKTARGSAHV